MKRSGLKTQITIRFVLLVLIIIALISIFANIFIGRQFETYVVGQQKAEADDIAENLSSQFGADGEGWNLDYVHGMGMYALNEGYIIKLSDADRNVLWDAEHHDMTLCHDIMENIRTRMEASRPALEGSFVTAEYDLYQDTRLVGYLDIGYYSPYAMDENDFQFLAALNTLLLIIGIVSLVAAVILGLLLARNLTRPISGMVEVTKKISEGNYETRLSETANARELASLSDAINQMAESLDEQETLHRQLTSDVAHELRTPVANISSYVEMMIDKTIEPTPERLSNCYAELQRLSGLIADLEQLQQEESRALRLEKTQVDLFELTKMVAENFQAQIQERHMHLSLDGDPAVVLADKDRILQVLTNLLSNAVKYTEDGGTITVFTENETDCCRVRVCDTGIGISPEDLTHIFDRFYRADKSRNRKTGGTGIGLTIAKTIAEAHGGTLTAESAPKKGSAFVLTLPRSVS